MQASQDSDETADIFWPGYVDAVTNLAINLLFVIAVMSIVVLGATLQIAQMTKKKAIEEAMAAQTASSDSHVQASQKGSHHKDANATLPGALPTLQQTVHEVLAKLEKTQQQLDQAQKQITELKTTRSEVVLARENKPTEPAHRNQIQAVPEAAVVVLFNPEVVTLSVSEKSELLEKLKKTSPLTTGRWQISVISPKGYSEAARLSFYRANAVRNSLLENGTPASAIDLTIQESAQAGADNRKVLVRWLP
jgi:outer membrane protein OmpA-like peptidoglycan-associated protein